MVDCFRGATFLDFFGVSLYILMKSVESSAVLTAIKESAFHPCSAWNNGRAGRVVKTGQRENIPEGRS